VQSISHNMPTKLKIIFVGIIQNNTKYEWGSKCTQIWYFNMNDGIICQPVFYFNEKHVAIGNLDLWHCATPMIKMDWDFKGLEG
jgi:hypothetical protein